jgi:hypothetical protein
VSFPHESVHLARMGEWKSARCPRGPGEKGEITVRKLVLGSFSLWVLVALAWAGDAWKDKSYQQWDKADVQKILNDSPWVKVAHIGEAEAILGNQGDAASANSGATPSAPITPTSRGAGGGGQPGPTPGESGGETGSNPPEISFTVRWLSSRTIREAFVRNAELSGQLKEADAAKDLSASPEMYQVMVFGPEMGGFAAATDSTLKEKVLLSCKKAKEKIAPASVNIQRTPDGKKVQAIVFSFPKQTAAGQPTIAATEKTVEFSCALLDVKFRVSFDLPKMQDSKGRDL